MIAAQRPPAVLWPTPGELSPWARPLVCNGIGPARTKDSSLAWALSYYPLRYAEARGLLEEFREAGDVHDLLYALGGTEQDRRIADAVFMGLLQQIVARRPCALGRLHGRLVAQLFYAAVRSGGRGSFRYRDMGPLPVKALEVELMLQEQQS